MNGPATASGLASPGIAVGRELDAAARVERQRAMRTLIQHPLLRADGPYAEEFGLVRRHFAWLRDWLARFPGWRLDAGSEFVRLRKIPASTWDGSRAARDPKDKTPFTRRQYVLFCLALAALERADRQTALGRLAEDVETLVASAELPAVGIEFDIEDYASRRDLVHVARFLVELHVLSRVNGDEHDYLHETGARDVLYNIHPAALAAVLNVRRGPSTVEDGRLEERISRIVEEPRPDTAEARNRHLRSTVVRRLLDDPVLYHKDLSPEELAYLHSQRPLLVKEIQEATGLHPEVRREGLALVDEGGDMTDVALPEAGTDGHLTLLLAEFLAEHARQDPEGVVGRNTIEHRTAMLISEHRKHWRKDVAMPGAETVLAGQTVDRLAALGLVRRTEDGVRPSPAIARYAVRTDPRLAGTVKEKES